MIIVIIIISTSGCLIRQTRKEWRKRNSQDLQNLPRGYFYTLFLHIKSWSQKKEENIAKPSDHQVNWLKRGRKSIWSSFFSMAVFVCSSLSVSPTGLFWMFFFFIFLTHTESNYSLDLLSPWIKKFSLKFVLYAKAEIERHSFPQAVYYSLLSQTTGIKRVGEKNQVPWTWSNISTPF